MPSELALQLRLIQLQTPRQHSIMGSGKLASFARYQLSHGFASTQWTRWAGLNRMARHIPCCLSFSPPTDAHIMVAEVVDMIPAAYPHLENIQCWAGPTVAHASSLASPLLTLSSLRAILRMLSKLSFRATANQEALRRVFAWKCSNNLRTSLTCQRQRK